MAVVVSPVAPRRMRRRYKLTAWLIPAVLLAGVAAYLSQYGQCEPESRFCVVEFPAIRSEVGIQWDSWTVFVSTDRSE